MNKKGEISTLKAWLILLASLIDDAIVLALIYVGLWAGHVRITWWIILATVIFVAVYVLIMHKAIIPAFRRRRITGAEGMVGMTGVVTEALKPWGEVKIRGEYWHAESLEGEIDEGGTVEVVSIAGLDLKVRKKQ